jgi:hypothetical protein
MVSIALQAYCAARDASTGKTLAGTQAAEIASELGYMGNCMA